MKKRNIKLFGALALAILLAGCVGPFASDNGDDDVGEETQEALELAPDTSSALMEVDTDIVDDDETFDLVDAFFPEEDLEDVLDEFEQELEEDPEAEEALEEFDLDDIETMVGFVSVVEDEEFEVPEEQTAFIVVADWDTDTILDSYNEDETTPALVEEEHAGHTIYVPEEPPQFGTEEAVGVIDDDTHVVGDREAVEQSLEVANDERDHASETLIDAQTDITDDALVSMSVEMDDEIEEDIEDDPQFSELVDLEVATFAYFTDDGNVGMESLMVFDDEDAAEAIDEQIDASLVMFEQELEAELEEAPPEEQEQIQAMLDQFDNLEVEQDGENVSLTWEEDVDTLAELIEEFAAQGQQPVAATP